jgi:hypothetical protein
VPKKVGLVFAHGWARAAQRSSRNLAKEAGHPDCAEEQACLLLATGHCSGLVAIAPALVPAIVPAIVPATVPIASRGTPGPARPPAIWQTCGYYLKRDQDAQKSRLGDGRGLHAGEARPRSRRNAQ